MKNFLVNILMRIYQILHGYMWLAIVCGVFGLIYGGIDGLYGDTELKTVSLADLSKESKGNSRYLEITGCYVAGDFVYSYDKNTTKVLSVIFPVISAEQISDYISPGLATTKLIVIRDQKKFSPDCAENETCLSDFDDIPDEGFTIRGMTVWGFDNIDSETEELIRTLNYSISSDVVVLKENDMPETTKTGSVLMLLGGILLLVSGIAFYIKITKSK
jgi:hypothetical protein